MRGYSATKPDGNLAKSLRRHFGEIYALNLDRNKQRPPNTKAMIAITNQPIRWTVLDLLWKRLE
jgi:hypothetical protein